MAVTILKAGDHVVLERTGVRVVVLEVAHVDVGRRAVHAEDCAISLTDRRTVVELLVDIVQREIKVQPVVEQVVSLLEHEVVTLELVLLKDTALRRIGIGEVSPHLLRTAAEGDTVGECHTDIIEILELVIPRIIGQIGIT